ncbi:MAG: citrate synthase [Lapillicoccus sp.]
MSADQAAGLLGVRLQTIYAYVSRGLLTRTRRTNGQGHRVSGFDREEVLRLVAERTRHRAGSLDVFVETDVTMLDPKGLLAFRGVPALDLLDRPFEDVAELLWSVDGVVTSHDPAAWALTDADGRVAGRVSLALSPGASDVDRVRAVVVALAGTDPERDDVGRGHVAEVGRRGIRAGVSALPLRQKAAGDLERMEAALWPRLTDRPATTAGLEALRTALILLVDHELAASTMAARIAAGTGADPWLVLLAGLAALGGPLHGRSSLAVEDLLALRAAGRSAAPDPSAAAPPGFGHQVYVGADPRAEALLDRVARLDPEGWPLVEDLLLDVSRTHGLSPNVDLALGALVRACGFVAGSGETIFALSRMAGWLAHGLEEAPQGLRFRARAVYTGEG